jgi:calcineurin-like phosphoesterase family protein
MKRWLTSDTHAHHANIITYCKRPFANSHEMNAAMIDGWNSVVAPDDIVYHLGDVALGGTRLISSFIDRLNGSIVLCCGNHDRSSSRMIELGYGKIVRAIPMSELFIEEFEDIGLVTLCHRAQDVDVSDASLPRLHLCGHIHEKWKHSIKGDHTFINVGVDQWMFRPISTAEIRQYIDKEMKIGA